MNPEPSMNDYVLYIFTHNITPEYLKQLIEYYDHYDLNLVFIINGVNGHIIEEIGEITTILGTSRIDASHIQGLYALSIINDIDFSKLLGHLRPDPYEKLYDITYSLYQHSTKRNISFLVLPVNSVNTINYAGIGFKRFISQYHHHKYYSVKHYMAVDDSTIFLRNTKKAGQSLKKVDIARCIEFKEILNDIITNFTIHDIYGYCKSSSPHTDSTGCVRPSADTNAVYKFIVINNIFFEKLISNKILYDPCLGIFGEDVDFFDRLELKYGRIVHKSTIYYIGKIDREISIRKSYGSHYLEYPSNYYRYVLMVLYNNRETLSIVIPNPASSGRRSQMPEKHKCDDIYKLLLLRIRIIKDIVSCS